MPLSNRIIPSASVPLIQAPILQPPNPRRRIKDVYYTPYVLISQTAPVYCPSAVASMCLAMVFLGYLISQISGDERGNALSAATSAVRRISLASDGVGGTRGGPMMPPGQRASRAARKAVVIVRSWKTCCLN
jgi:hypothetical protein